MERRRARHALVAPRVLLLVALLVLDAATSVVRATVVQQQVVVPGRYDYKRSFKKPYFLPTVEAENKLPHFSIHGDVILSADYIRLAASVRSQHGAIWAELPTDYENWSVEIKFLISGRGRLGGDGIAFWYTKESQQVGPVYGNKDKWDGLGIILDTYDNDGWNNNPTVLAMLNDGTVSFNHNQDGNGQEAASCQRQFRNPSKPTSMRIDYLDQKLTVLMDTSDSGKSYSNCFTIENLKLPTGYYFGISAATGGLADDHDVFSFETTRLYSSQEQGAPSTDEPTITQEQEKQLREVLHKVQDMREHETRERDGGSTEERGYSMEIEAVLSKIDALAAMHSDLAARLDNTGGQASGGHPSPAQSSLNRVLDDQQRIMNKLHEIENALKDGQHRGAGGSSGDNLPHTLENRLSSIEATLQSSLSTVQKVMSDTRLVMQLVQGNQQGATGQANNNYKQADASFGTESGPLNTLNIILLVIIVILIGAIIFMWMRTSKTDYKKFN